MDLAADDQNTGVMYSFGVFVLMFTVLMGYVCIGCVVFVRM